MSCDEQLATHRLQARLVPIRGEVLEVAFFLRGVDHHHGVSDEYIGTRLNDPSLKFIPICVGKSVELFQVAEIAYVEVSGPLPEIQEFDDANASHASVILHLVNGKRLDGALVFMMPPEQCRVSDVLNAAGLQFLLLVSAGRSYYVNRSAILRVQEA